MQNDKNRRFKNTLTVKERSEESAKILKLYPDRIPIIVEKATKSKLPDLDINKYLFMKNFKVFQLNTLIRSKINLNKAEAVYLFVNNNVVLRGDLSMTDVYDEYKDADGFIYIDYCEYNTFGGE